MEKSFSTISLSISIFITIIHLVPHVSSHGRMMEPPARNTMWRFGFPTKANYEDSELFCGGIKVQWEDNKGKCGVCGDSYSGLRDHETGGFYARNITTRTYAPGSPIDIVIDIVTNHGGRFKFDMCWRNETSEKETEECFEKLQLVNGSYIYHIPSHENQAFKRVIQVQLPRDRTCDKCILRWHWEASNHWGKCSNGTEATGCGPQETWINCSDIGVNHNNGIRGPAEVGNDDEKRWLVHRSLQ